MPTGTSGKRGIVCGDCAFCHGGSRKKKRSQQAGPTTVNHKTIIQYPCGTRISKWFDKADNNPKAAWFKGTITKHTYKGEGRYEHVMNFIQYDDGDKEELFNSDLENQQKVQILEISSTQPQQDEEPSQSVKHEQEDEGSRTLSSSSAAALTGPRTTSIVASRSSNASHVTISSNESDDDDLVPDAAPSCSSILDSVLSTATEDLRVKQEGSCSSLSDAERRERAQRFKAWVKANTDPRTKQGRFVFARACKKRCLTTILGGQGMDPWPRVHNVPPIIDMGNSNSNNNANPFIRRGEYYVAGNEAWNPFGPRFPGDHGLVNTEAIESNPEQKEFHLFVECSRQAHKRHWHGRLAAGGRMYVGVYQWAEDGITSAVEFNSTALDYASKLSIAGYYVRQDYKHLGGNQLRLGVNHKHRQDAQRRVSDDDDECWHTMSQEQKDTRAMVEYLTDINYTMNVGEVEFVRFDEELYQCLVDHGCAAARGQDRARVELTPSALHHYL